jgi:hypothetical protein
MNDTSLKHMAKSEPVDMITKMYERIDSKDKNDLPDRIFLHRNSLLTEMFNADHFHAIRCVCFSIVIGLIIQFIFNCFNPDER